MDAPLKPSIGDVLDERGRSVVSNAPQGDNTEPHAWFDRMRALPTCIGFNSLRSQALIDGATPAPPNRLYRYVWPSDTHPEAFDACKYTLPALRDDGTMQESQPTNQKIVLPLNVNDPGAIVIVSWEFLYTGDWKRAFTPLPGEDWTGYKFKTFQLTHPDDKIYFESRNLWGRARGSQFVSVADVRNYDLGTTSAEITQNETLWGVKDPTGYMPTGERAIPNFGADTGNAGGPDIPVSTLLRYYKEIRLGVDASAFESWNRWRPTLPTSQFPAWAGPLPAGSYNMLTEVIVPERGAPLWVLDRVPAYYKAGKGLGKFYAEMNTSAHIQRHGDAIGYIRNMVAWRAAQGLADDPSPIERPVR